MSVHGEYCATHYIVFIDDEPVYEAGNHPAESQGYVDAPAGVSLDTMRAFCLTTTREMAAEEGLPFGGVQRMDNDG